jgi:predicted transglutaminase-like cysteine proteinase
VPAPAGFISFCIRFADQCDAPPGEPTEFVLTEDRWRLLLRINADVNEAIWPENDEAHYGRPEYWTIPNDGYGDCDDYALTKRKELIAHGLPERALRIAIVNSPQSGRHAVLVAVTDRGDFVLDNLTDDAVERRKTPYAWIEQQDASNPRAWVSLTPQADDAAQSAVGTVK